LDSIKTKLNNPYLNLNLIPLLRKIPLPCFSGYPRYLLLYVLYDLFADIEAEEVGHDLHHGAHPTVVGVTAVRQLRRIDLACLHGLSGDHFLGAGAGAHQNLGPPWTLNLLSE
jgi:hypothetical protein